MIMPSHKNTILSQLHRNIRQNYLADIATEQQILQWLDYTKSYSSQNQITCFSHKALDSDAAI